ncbi:hypothetical protein VTO42DRAFT_8161 [Malbranchea cinnamomea]
MPKRKRADSEDSGLPKSKDRKLSLRATRLEQQIEHGVVLLHRALKVARGFERQKLGRRQKTARGNNDIATLDRLEKEVVALKSLDLYAASERYLIKQLVKTKRVAESPVFALLDESKRTLPKDAPKDGPTANVTARLFKSNPVRDVLPGIMEEIRKIVGISSNKKEPVSAKQQDKVKGSGGVSQQESASEGESESEASFGEPSDEERRYEARLAPSGSESESENDVDGETPQKQKPNGQKYDLARDISLSPTPSESESESPPPAAQKSKKAKVKAAPKETSTTTFLPSLMGGYWSGSESEPEDAVAAAAAGKKVRKNRMGQQARRKLWEKKYGAQANHIRKAKEKEQQSRDSGWDLRRGATDSQEAGKEKGKFGKGKGANPKAQAKGDSKPPKEDRSKKPAGGKGLSKSAADNKPLHPSWEAAKRVKEKIAQTSFQGKKVVFD